MSLTKITAKKREELGKGAVKRLRKEGFVPGNLYGNDIENINLSISERELRKIALGSGQIIKVQVDGGKEHNVLVREYQTHPITQNVIHLDLLEISMTEKLTTVAALVVIGEPKGASEGGILQFGVREVEIECLPMDIPEGIEVDVSDLGVGDSIRVEDLVAPEGVTILTDPEQTIANVVVPTFEEEEEVDEEEELVIAADEEGEEEVEEETEEE